MLRQAGNFPRFPLAVLLFAWTQALFAQNPSISTTPLLRTSVSGHDELEAVMMSAVFQPQASTGWHVHPGDEYATLLEGTLEIRYKDGESRQVNAGQAYHNPRGVVHETVNMGSIPARVVSTFIVDKGQPVVQPMP